MLRAGALLYAIFITLVVAIIALCILWGHFYSSTGIQDSIRQAQIESNINSAINKSLIFPDSLPYNQEIPFEFDNNAPVILERKHWGMYDLILAKTAFRKDSIQETIFVGQGIASTDKTALYIADYEKELYLSGDVVIKGECFVPKGFFKQAYLTSKTSFTKREVPAKINKSDSKLPDVSRNILNHAIGNLNKRFTKPSSSLELAKYLTGKDSVEIPFFKPPLILYTEEEINLSRIYLKGNIIIYSSKPLYVKSSAHLDKVLIYAPEIHVEPNVKGNMQLFATDSIVVDQNAVLTYPSCVGVFSPNVSSIRIAKSAKVYGNIIQYQDGEGDHNSTLTIEPKSEVYGIVYSNGFTQHQGKIIGSLYTGHVFLKLPSGYYENYLSDMEIDFQKLPREYVSGIIFDKKDQRILLWEH